MAFQQQQLLLAEHFQNALQLNNTSNTQTNLISNSFIQNPEGLNLNNVDIVPANFSPLNYNLPPPAPPLITAISTQSQCISNYNYVGGTPTPYQQVNFFFNFL